MIVNALLPSIIIRQEFIFLLVFSHSGAPVYRARGQVTQELTSLQGLIEDPPENVDLIARQQRSLSIQWPPPPTMRMISPCFQSSIECTGCFGADDAADSKSNTFPVAWTESDLILFFLDVFATDVTLCALASSHFLRASPAITRSASKSWALALPQTESRAHLITIG